MASRSLSHLAPEFRETTKVFLAAAKDAGIDVLVYCTKRSNEEQARLWRQGRSGRVISEILRRCEERPHRLVDGSEIPSEREVQIARAVASTEKALGRPLYFEERGDVSMHEAKRNAALVARLLTWQGRTINGVGPQYEERVVTNAMPGESAHNAGLAFDCVPIVDGALGWRHEPSWELLGDIAGDVGLDWSGDWRRFVERVHFQAQDWRAVAAGTEDDLDGVL